MSFVLLSLLPIAGAVVVFCFGAAVLLFWLIAGEYYIAAAICLAVLVVALAPMLGPLAYRFLARAFPLNASGDQQVGALRFLWCALVTMLAICIVLTAWGSSLFWGLMLPSGNWPAAIIHFADAIELMGCCVLLLFSTCVTWGLSKLLRFHDNPTAWTSKASILFLRSFGSVSDSAALGILVRGAGIRSRVALLASPEAVMASWDPMTLAVAGFSFRHPFHSVPIYLESTDQRWAEDVNRLARAANLVVIDTSHRSPGLSREIELLSEPGLSEKTVRFEELAIRGAKGNSSRKEPEEIIFLERSRLARLTSQIVAFVFTYMGSVALSVLIVGVVNVSGNSKLSDVVLWSSLLYSLASAIWAASALCPEAGFTRRSAARLVQIIRQRALTFSATRITNA